MWHLKNHSTLIFTTKLEPVDKGREMLIVYNYLGGYQTIPLHSRGQERKHNTTGNFRNSFLNVLQILKIKLHIYLNAGEHAFMQDKHDSTTFFTKRKSFKYELYESLRLTQVCIKSIHEYEKDLKIIRILGCQQEPAMSYKDKLF